MLSDYKQINDLQSASMPIKEYVSFKKENPDSILLFQIGSFYETLFQDAKIFSELTGVVLSARKFSGVGEVLQAGVHIQNANFYIKKLLNENIKVCVCEEYNDQDNVLHRKVVRKYTPGTIIENEFLDANDNNYILAVFEFNNIFYLSYADVSTGQFYKTQGSFSDVKFEIEKIAPDELLILDSQTKIFESLIAKFNTTFLDKTYFANENIENTILKYCKKVQKDFLIELEDVIEYKINKFLIMDEITRHNLEITRTKRFLKKKGSVLWFLNSAKTPMGMRLLKKYLSEPLLNIDEIIKRQEAIGELVNNKAALFNLEESLENFCDLSRMCAKISNSTAKPKELFIIVKNSAKLCDLADICKSFKAELLHINQELLDKTLGFITKVRYAINEDAPDELKSGGIISDNYDANLDYLRAKLNNLKYNIKEYENLEKKKTEIDKLKIDYSSTIGYYIEVPSSTEAAFCEGYLRKQKLSKCSRFTTDELQELEINIGNITTRINELEYQLFKEIRSMAIGYVESIRNLAKDLARIDVLASCARCAVENKFVKPEFQDNGIFIKNGYHPSLIKLNNLIVKNDTYLEDSTMIVLTGANMSGKSTFLKYNAIICILAQMGCFVPADSAQIKLVDKIFLRQGSTDDIINNNSSFMVEMNDLKFILDNTTDCSFVLLDEPAKSTNASEGGAIARAYCEYFLKNYKTKAIIVTHNFELTKLEQQFPKRVFNYVVGVKDKTGTNFRKISKGTVRNSLALNTARLAQLPDEILQLAEKYMK